ncbi:MAG TPA: hypothetical protein VFM59_02075 [Salinimicrobium sp.]|nr:hypothetical protein [Salinimicrobium sp.]
MDWCCDLPKVPNLIEHFNEQAEDSGISFLNFMDYHYGDKENSPSHENDGHDEELPFQGSHSCCNIIAYIDSSNFETYSLKVSEVHTAPLFYQPSFSSASLGSVFQPPKA